MKKLGDKSAPPSRIDTQTQQLLRSPSDERVAGMDTGGWSVAGAKRLRTPDVMETCVWTSDRIKSPIALEKPLAASSVDRTRAPIHPPHIAFDETLIDPEEALQGDSVLPTARNADSLSALCRKLKQLHLPRHVRTDLHNHYNGILDGKGFINALYGYHTHEANLRAAIDDLNDYVFDRRRSPQSDDPKSGLRKIMAGSGKPDTEALDWALVAQTQVPLNSFGKAYRARDFLRSIASCRWPDDTENVRFSALRAASARHYHGISLVIQSSEQVDLRPAVEDFKSFYRRLAERLRSGECQTLFVQVAPLRAKLRADKVLAAAAVRQGMHELMAQNKATLGLSVRYSASAQRYFEYLAIVDILSAKGNNAPYCELQGSIAPQHVALFNALCAQKKINVKFLHNLGSASLAKQNRYSRPRVVQKFPEAEAHLQRPEYAGVDFCGPEHAFSANSTRDALRETYRLLKRISKERGDRGLPPLVMRIHVGEGSGDHHGGDNFQARRQEARKNIDYVLKALEYLHRQHAWLSRDIPVRLGHVTHITFTQAMRLRQLDVGFEINYTSNVTTGGILQNSDGPLMTLLLADLISRLQHKTHNAINMVFNCDGNGVMGADTLEKEFEHAKEIVLKWYDTEAQDRPVVHASHHDADDLLKFISAEKMEQLIEKETRFSNKVPNATTGVRSPVSSLLLRGEDVNGEISSADVIRNLGDAPVRAAEVVQRILRQRLS